jgi:long-chain fatty acid transport protein
MMRKSFAVLAVLTVLALAGTAFAGGFRIPEQGAAAMGQGNAFVGQADDPSAVQFNPAGLTQLPGSQLQAGLTYVGIKSHYTSPASYGALGYDMKDTVAVPPQLYYTNNLGQGKWWLGLGVTAPFGLSSEWNVPLFQYLLTKTNLEIVKVNPVAAYKVNDAFSVGFGIDYYNVMEAMFANNVPASIVTPSGAVKSLKGDGTSWGYNLGALYKISDAVSLGLSYRSGTTAKVKGTVDVVSNSTGQSVAAFGVPMSASVNLNLPATAALGLCYRPDPAWKINLDFDWTGWSAYDELRIVPALGPPSVLPKDYKDTIATRVGAAYRLNPSWVLRGGFLIDSTPVPSKWYDGRLPDGNRVGYSLGAGYQTGPWTFDLGAMYVDVQKFAVTDGVTVAGPQTVNGDYKGNITLCALSAGYKF